MNFNFQEWLLILEELKPKSLAFKILGNTVDNAGKPVLSTDPNIIKTTQEFNKIFSASIPEAQQKNIYPTAAYVYKTNPSVGEEEFSKDLKDYYKFVIANQLPVLSFNDDGNVTGNNIIGKSKSEGNPYLHYADWATIIHTKNSENEDEVKKKFHQTLYKSTGDVSDQELVAKSPDEKIKVYKSNAVDKCIILGRGQKFCISQPGNSMFKSYRDTKDSTFYFVYDNTRNDDLKVVVVDATISKIEITDSSNRTNISMQDPYVTDKVKQITSSPDLYLKYLKEKGVDTTVFKNEPKTEKEEAEETKLGSTIKDLAWFKSLTYEEKKNYIGRGHRLSDEQFNWLVSTNSEPLLKQHVSLGIILWGNQLNLVLNDPYFKDLKLNYLNARMNGIPNTHLEVEEYLAMPPKYKQELAEKYGDKLKDYILSGKIKIEDYLNFSEDKKTELKNLFGNSRNDLILPRSMKIEDYLNLPEDKKTEIKNLFGNYLNTLILQNPMKIEDYLKLPEDKKTEIKNLIKINVSIDYLFASRYINIEDYLDFSQDKKTEIKNLLGDNVKYLMMYKSMKLEDYMDLPEDKKTEIQGIYGNEFVNNILMSHYIKIEDYLNFPEDKKTKIKNLFKDNVINLITHNSMKIEDYLNLPEDKKTEIKNLFKDNVINLILLHSMKIEDYLNLPEDKKTEIKNLIKDNVINLISSDRRGNYINMEDYFNLPEDKKKEFKTLFKDNFKNTMSTSSNLFKKYKENPNLEFTDEIKDFIDCSNSDLIHEILTQPNKKNVNTLTDILRSSSTCKKTIDSILTNSDSMRAVFYGYYDDKVKVINLLHILSNYSNEMPITNMSSIIEKMRSYLGSSSKYIVMFRRFFQNFASKLQDAWSVNHEQEDIHYSDVNQNNENSTINLFAGILKYSFENKIDKDAVSTIKFIVDTIGNENIPRTTRDLIKDKVGEEGYKFIFPEKQQQASPEQIDKAYRGDSTREARNYKF